MNLNERSAAHGQPMPDEDIRPASPGRRSRTALNAAIPQPVLDAITDPGRLTPMLAGASCIRQHRGQGQLVVRTVTADVEVSAPTALLDRVFSLCDGTRTIDDLLKHFAADAEREEFREFIAFLLDQGALIDANLVCAQAVRYGFQFSPFGLAASAKATNLICNRFAWNERQGIPSPAIPHNSVHVADAPLSALFEARTSQYTFDDRSIAVDALHRLLWSAAGIVNVQHPGKSVMMPQRTIASAGGMHLLKLFVALRRPVGPYAPGIYRVDYPHERLVALHRVSDDIASLPLAFSRPWQISFATGALFVVADPVVGAMRYRSRSLQYLFMEAGAALHNVGLSAHALGLGQATIGGFFERQVATLCRLDRELVLGSAIFGARATQQQQAGMARSLDFDFAWVNGESPRFRMPFHLARARIGTADGDERPHTWGRDADPALAMRKAMAEAIEREGFTQPRNIFDGAYTEVDGAVDPTACIRYSDAQYDAPGFAAKRFDPAKTTSWALARNLVTDEPARVLAELVFSRDSLRAQGHAVSHLCTQATSSGCAAGVSAEDATERATREVIERHAFMQHWLSQTPGRVVPQEQWPRAIARRMQAIEATGCRVQLQNLGTPWMHVAMMSLQHQDMHFTTLGMAASHDFTAATAAAVDESESRLYAWLNGHATTITSPEEVLTPDHHFELYGLKRSYRRADRVLFPAEAEATAAWPRALKTKTLPDIVRKLGKVGLQPLVIDITPDKHCVDQGRTPLSVVKVLVPGLLPVSFGHRKEPLGMVAKVHPAARFPHPFP